MRHQALVSCDSAINVTITGGGTIDGQGFPWYASHNNGTLEFGRPHLIETLFSKDLTLTNLTLQNSAFWTVHPYASRDVYAADLTILAPRDVGNTDGFDPDSSVNVLLERSYISVGDDAIAIKSGIDYAGRQFAHPAANITIRHSTLLSKWVSIGSEMSGGVHNVTVHDCVLGYGVHLKTQRGRGGTVSAVRFANLTSAKAQINMPIAVNMFYTRDIPPTNATGTPIFTDLAFSNITVDDGAHPGQFVGLPESPITHVSMDGVHILRSSNTTWQCSALDGMSVQDVSPKWNC